MSAKTSPIGIDFFCGCGGMTAGLIQAGVEVRLGIDIDPLCKETYERNNRVPFECTDIRDLTYKKVETFLSGKGKRPVLFAACAPCQPFSKARKCGKKQHPARNLMMDFLHFVLRFRPEYVLCENVPQLKSSPSGRRIIGRFLRSMHEAGYSTDHRIVNAADFDVPQHRLRLIILATRVLDEIKISEGPTKKNQPTVRHAIGTLPSIKAGERLSSPHNHWAAKLSKINLCRIRLVPGNGGDLRSVPFFLRPKSRRRSKKYGIGSFFDVYGRMRWDAPAPTLTTRCNSYSNGRYGHPQQNRAISIREAAALQSFPNRYRFFVSKPGDAARLIGNAVPLRLAYHLARQLFQ